MSKLGLTISKKGGLHPPIHFQINYTLISIYHLKKILNEPETYPYPKFLYFIVDIKRVAWGWHCHRYSCAVLLPVRLHVLLSIHDHTHTHP